MEPQDEHARSSAGETGRLGGLAASARGWHRIQLAVLGFVGLCGVLWAGGDQSGPRWLQWLAGGLVVLALALACVATYLVGRVAHPFDSPPGGAPGAVPQSTVAVGARRLRIGVRLTYVAVAVLVVATLSAWWPSATSTGAVQARDAAGQAWCGELLDAPPGAVRLATADGPATLSMDRVVTLRPVDGC